MWWIHRVTLVLHWYSLRKGNRWMFGLERKFGLFIKSYNSINDKSLSWSLEQLWDKVYKDFRLIYLKTKVREKNHVRKHNIRTWTIKDILLVIPHHCTYKKTTLQSFLGKKVFDEVGSSMMKTGAYNFYYHKFSKYQNTQWCY